MFCINYLQNTAAIVAVAIGALTITGCLLGSEGTKFNEQNAQRSLDGAAYTGRVFIDPQANENWLGRGVESITGEMTDPCVTGEVKEYNSPEMNVSFQTSKTATQSLEELSGRVEGSVNLVLFGGGAEVNMHSRLQDVENTASVVLRISYKGKTLRLENRSLNNRGQGVVGQSVEQIAEACGDQYIDHVQYGNELYVVAQMAFASSEEYQKFVTRVKFRALFWTATKTFTDEFYDYAGNAVLSVKALSPSPLPGPILEALGGDEEMSCEASSRDDLSACLNAGDRIVDFIFDNGATGYANWLRNDSNLHASWYASSNYETTGHREFAGVAATSVDGLSELSDELSTLLTEQYSLRNVLVSYGYSPRPDRRAYRDLIPTVDQNIAALQQAMDTCRSSLNVATCQSAINSAKAQQTSIDLIQ